MLRFEKQYDFKGQVRSYQGDETVIPCDPESSSFRNASAAIASGSATLCEPRFNSATETTDASGKLTGFDLDRPPFWVPNDSQNELFNVVSSQIRAGTCIRSSPQVPTASPLPSKLIFAVVLREPWPHLAGRYHSEITYRSSREASGLPIEFGLSNLPESQKRPTQDAVKEAVWTLTGETFSLPSMPIQCGLLEIAVPVNLLAKLFKSERRLLSPFSSNILSNVYELHIARTGRKSRGPEISWLVSNSHLYIEHFVASVGNLISRAFQREYGGITPVIIESTIRNGLIVFGEYQGGSRNFLHYSRSDSYGFSLSGRWSEYSPQIQQISDPPGSSGNHASYILLHVETLLKLGLHMEALLTVNAFLEAYALRALLSACTSDPQLEPYIRGLNHRKRFELIRDLFRKDIGGAKTIGKGAITAIENMELIYEHRNRYIHDLILPDAEPELSTLKRREIEEMLRPFIDHHQQMLFFSGMRSVVWHANEQINAFLRKRFTM